MEINPAALFQTDRKGKRTELARHVMTQCRNGSILHPSAINLLATAYEIERFNSNLTAKPENQANLMGMQDADLTRRQYALLFQPIACLKQPPDNK